MFGIFVTTMDTKVRFDLVNGPQVFDLKIAKILLFLVCSWLFKIIVVGKIFGN